MRRLRISGASVATPQLGEAELRQAVDRLGVASHFDVDGVQEIHLRIAEIIGLWFAEQEAKEALPVAKALLSTGRNLLEASRVLSDIKPAFTRRSKFKQRQRRCGCSP